MAVNTPKPTQKITSMSDIPQGYTQQQPQSAYTGTMPVFGITSRLATYGSGGEVFEKLYAIINGKVKFLNEEIKTTEKYAAVKLLKQNAGLNYSAIVVCEATDTIVSGHILMIEKTGDYPEKLIENISGQRYEITRTPADALDDKYVSQAQLAVAEAMKVDINSVTIVDGTLVPNEFDVANETLVAELLSNTFNAIHSENAMRVNDYKGMNLSELMAQNNNGKFFVNLYFNSDSTNFFDQAGMPVRQDVCIGLSYKINQMGNNRSINQGNDTFEIVKTYGYVDFEYVGPSIINGMVIPQMFLPNFIITHIDSQVAPTPDILMLGVASVISLNEDMNWMQAFRSTPARKNEIDYNDIGALNVEGNIEKNPSGFGAKYNTKSKTFGINELNNYVQSLIRPSMTVSIDIPKAGPETWFSSVFQYIKFRNDKEAYNRVNASIGHMTNGIYQPNGIAMFADTTNKIHGGYYKTKDGVMDIRHLSSYLAVANYIADTNQTPVLISQYTNTLYNSSIPPVLRAAERKKFIDDMSNKTAVYKQYYDRITFSEAFMSRMIGSLKQCGFSPVFSNMGAVNDMFVRRSTADFGSAVLGNDVRLMNANTNVFGGYYAPQSWTRQF
jgi:hypothetical protein